MLLSVSDARLRLEEVFTQVFGSLPLVVSDSKIVLSWFKDAQFKVSTFADLHSLGHKELKNVVIFGMDKKDLPPSYTAWRRAFKSSRVLIFPLLAFDASMDAALYAIDLFSRSNLITATRHNQEWLKRLVSSKKPFIFRGNGCNLECEIKDGVTVMGPKTEPRILPGEWEGIGAFFEVGMVLDPEGFQSAYILNGELSIPGVAVAHHRQASDDVGIQASHAWEFLSDLHRQGKFPLKMTIHDSVVTNISTGDLDIASNLLDLTNPNYGLLLTEMAISTNHDLPNEVIDWTINSQMNEGLPGIHVGLGDGLTGAHIDFICPGVHLVDESTLP